MSKIKSKNKLIVYCVWNALDGTKTWYEIENDKSRGLIRKAVHAEGHRRKDIEKNYMNLYRKYTFHRKQNHKAGICCDYVNEDQTY